MKIQLSHAFASFLCVGIFLLISSCTSRPTPQMLAALDSQKAAAISAEKRVKVLELDRDALKQELQNEEAKRVQLQSELAKLGGGAK